MWGGGGCYGVILILFLDIGNDTRASISPTATSSTKGIPLCTQSTWEGVPRHLGFHCAQQAAAVGLVVLRGPDESCARIESQYRSERPAPGCTASVSCDGKSSRPGGRGFGCV